VTTFVITGDSTGVFMPFLVCAHNPHNRQCWAFAHCDRRRGLVASGMAGRLNRWISASSVT